MDTNKDTRFWVEKDCLICQTKFWSRIKHNQKTCSAKCSGIYVAQNPNRIAKIKNTKLKKYGNESYVNPEKAKLTCLKKYGVDNASKSQVVIDKIKESSQENFGTDWAFQSKMVKEKIKQYNTENYGVEHVSQREDIKEKKIETCIRKYGVENPFQDKDIQEKIASTNIRLYGISHPSQMSHVKRIKRKKFIDQFYPVFVTDHKYTKKCTPLFTKEEYINSDKINLYKFKCNTCGNIFLDHIDCHVPRCLKCEPITSSIFETEIFNYIASLITDPITRNSHNILPSKRELDIYIPSKKLAIEFDGLYFHSELFGKNNKYHISKTEECENAGIHLIHIFEDEWKNKQEIVKQKLSSKLVQSKRLGARKLIIKSINNKEKNEFLEKYHIQGKDNSSIKYGGYHNNELVCVATFSKERIALGTKYARDGIYELVRFATSRPIVGGLDKILKVLKFEHNAASIVSFADRRYTSLYKNIYQSIGMKLVKITPPNYWYFRNGYFQRWHRFSFRKSVLKSKLPVYDEKSSEWENMIANGYNRIWDCGNLKYEHIL